MANSYDAIVVGGGHNGLVAAAYLARSGARTLVLESRATLGGAATTEAPWPDAPQLRVTRLSYVMSLMPPTIVNDLSLERHGYKVHPMGPYYQAFPEGGSLTIYEDDPARTYDEIAKWSKKDAEAWPKWNAWLAGIADVMGPLLTRVPPALGSHRPSDLVDTARLAWSQRGLDIRTTADITRLMTMSIADLLDDWFESPQIKGALAVNGVIGTWAGPCEPGTAYVMAHHSIGDVGDGQLGSWGYPEGGMGAVSAAIAASARSFGAEIRTNARVERLIVRDGHVRRRRAGQRRTGARTGRGDLAAPEDRVPRPGAAQRAAAVVRVRHRALEDAQRRREDQPRARRNCRTSPRTRATGSPSTTPARSRWRRPIEFIEQAFQDAREGRPATQPFSDGVIPTSLDKTLCPDGTHIMSLFTQWVPADWNEAPHTEELEAYADRLIDLYDAVAPNFKSSITHRDIVGPHEMEQEYGLVGGNIFHGELSLEQLFHMRPAPGYADYRTPIAGLYNASSATHAGGGVCGIPGWQAARAALKDKKRGDKRTRADLARRRFVSDAGR